ncbi:MAG: NAD-dependent DNA ligase LigA [Lachnospiraceae bacterium]|nr:NAD-dependent DNA ligase LigA [Candidatus Colinaster scatohippi]
MRELINILNEASKAYYAEDREIISNYEYDALYDELVQLEAQTGITMSDSPTINVGYESVDELPKEQHESPMLSLGKTKDREELRSWLNGHSALLSWKLDGLTIVLTYQNGVLDKAVTRGNGEVGEVITGNAKVFKNIPHTISFKEKLVIRGEAVIKYSDFEKINAEIEDVDSKYKNPRNLCSGSVRQLNNEVTAGRNVFFFAFNLVKAGDTERFKTRTEQLEFLKTQGFDVVEYHEVKEETILAEIESYASKIADYDVPSDGLVLTYNDIEYGRSLGRTAKFPRDAIAFKWQDELKETKLIQVEWSPSRTGLINPVAIFEPIELEGTTVSRASVHNISIVRDLMLGIGDKITVYKANMIIPQIAENLTRSDNLVIPDTCPCCGGKTEIRRISEAESLYCINDECPAKKVKAFALFVSRDAMNIDGVSESTLEKFLGAGYLHSFTDIYHLDRFEEQIVGMDGFGRKSYENLLESIDKSRVSTLPRVIYSLGIPGIGVANAKMLCRYYDYDSEQLINASFEELNEIEGIGEVLAKAICEYFAVDTNRQLFCDIMNELELEEVKVDRSNDKVNGKSFVITGSLNTYSGRDELKALIESLGGKVTGSVTGKTEALINNDITSNSSKNKKAKELGVMIISEEDFNREYIGKEETR